MLERAFTLVELLAAIAIVLVLSMVATGAGWKVHESASLAVSANNIRQLSIGGMSYLAEHNSTYWPYRSTDSVTRNVTWWFGMETRQSQVSAGEGKRNFDAAMGPLGGYIPKGFRPDPSFSLGGGAFKPKYQAGYIGIGYNTEIGGGMTEGYASKDPTTADKFKLANHWQLSDPSKVVVFCTSAQVNTFQKPASPNNPMLEEYYGVDGAEVTVHFRHNGRAMVSFASGNAGFLDMDESTRDSRMPKADVGRFAPVGDTTYLK